MTINPKSSPIRLDSSRVTGWWSTDAERLVACPRCGATAGSSCRQPKGRKQWPPHDERAEAVRLAAGGTTAPWEGAASLAAWKEAAELARVLASNEDGAL